MVTIRTCYSLPEAQVIQSYLEGSGIEAFLPDEMTVQNYWLWTNAIGGVRVQVLEEDAERAAEVLDETSVGNQKEAAKSCPHCGATLKESHGFGLYLKMLLVLMLSIPVRSKPTWRCAKCGAIPS
jgi:Putative prokaryotic signal transducing protein